MEVERFIYGAKKMEVYPNVSPIKLIHLWFNSSNLSLNLERWKHNYMMLVLDLFQCAENTIIWC